MPIRIKPGGINIAFDPATGAEVEAYSSTCSHCQKITDFPNRRQMMEFVDVCRGCMKLICLGCLDRMHRGVAGCVPYEKQAELQELEFKLRSRVHLQGWACY